MCVSLCLLSVFVCTVCMLLPGTNVVNVFVGVCMYARQYVCTYEHFCVHVCLCVLTGGSSCGFVLSGTQVWRFIPAIRLALTCECGNMSRNFFSGGTVSEWSQSSSSSSLPGIPVSYLCVYVCLYTHTHNVCDLSVSLSLVFSPCLAHSVSVSVSVSVSALPPLSSLASPPSYAQPPPPLTAADAVEADK
jgi:hypothetical protein